MTTNRSKIVVLACAAQNMWISICSSMCIKSKKIKFSLCTSLDPYAAALECQGTNYIEQSFEKCEMKLPFFTFESTLRTLSISLTLEMFVGMIYISALIVEKTKSTH